jgi:hypothetical protein
MSQAWRPTDAAGTSPHPKPAWAIATFMVALLSPSPSAHIGSRRCRELGDRAAAG